MILGRHPDGYVLKEVLLPFIQENYMWVTVDESGTGKNFEKDRTYQVHTMSGYTLPSSLSISINSIKNRKDGTFISFVHKKKTITKKTKKTLFGNQVAIFEKYYISAGNRQRKLLYSID